MPPVHHSEARLEVDPFWFTVTLLATAAFILLIGLLLWRTIRKP